MGKHTPKRPALTADLYGILLSVADQVAPGFKLALVLAHETGHRIGAIRQLRWSDIDFERDVIQWRVQHDKIGLEHDTPMSPAARAALGSVRTGGLEGPQTILKCYQRADPGTMRQALATRMRLEA